MQERLARAPGDDRGRLRLVGSQALRRNRSDAFRKALTIAAALVIAAGAIGFAFLAFSSHGTVPAGQSELFARVHGWIAYGGHQILGVNPADPADRIPLTDSL